MSDLKHRLLAVKSTIRARPTIAELEAILADTDPPKVQIMPDGSISATENNFANPDGPEAAAEIERLEGLVARYREALEFYADHKHWHWAGDVWVWNGPKSASFHGCDQHPNKYPDREAVANECGFIACQALQENTNAG